MNEDTANTAAEQEQEEQPIEEQPITQEPAQEPEPPKEDIPAELSGVSEDVAREIMQEAKATEPTQAEGQQPHADADSDTKQNLPPQNVPYARLKQVVDQKNAALEQLKAYQQRFGDLNAAQPRQPQAAPAAPPPQQAAPQPWRPTLNPDAAKQLLDVAHKKAQQYLGLTDEQVEEIAYADDDDPRKSQFNAVYELAKSDVFAQHRQIQMRQSQAAQIRQLAQRQAIEEFNSLVDKETQEPDFNDVMAYINRDYGNEVTPLWANTVAESHARIQAGTASPQDFAVLERFYYDGKAAYRAKQQRPQQAAVSSVAQAQQRPRFPRAGNVQGTTAPNGDITAAQLEKMVNETPWEQIPDKYKNMLKGIQ